LFPLTIPMKVPFPPLPLWQVCYWDCSSRFGIRCRSCPGFGQIWVQLERLSGWCHIRCGSHQRQASGEHGHGSQCEIIAMLEDVTFVLMSW